MASTMAAQILSTPTVSPPVSLGVSPHHAILSGPDGHFSPTYCLHSERDKTVSEAYDLYYKGSLIDSLGTACHELYPTKTAIAEGNGCTSLVYQQLYKRITHMGRGLAEMGLHPNDKAVLCMLPGNLCPLEWLIACYGLWSHGMQVVVVNTEAQLEIALRETRARIVVTTTTGSTPAASYLRKNKIQSPRIIVADTGSNLPLNDEVNFTYLKDVEENGAARHNDVPMAMPRPEPSQHAMIVYSAHTPNRAVVLTHGNLYAAITVTTPRLQKLAHGDVLTTAVVEPLSHLTPFILASACLIAGGTVGFGLEAMGALKPTIVACTAARQEEVSRALGGGHEASLLQYNSPAEDPAPGASSTVSGGTGSGFWYSPMAVSGVGLMPAERSSAEENTMLPGTEMRLRHFENPSSSDAPRLAEVMVKGPCVSKGYYTPNTELGELDRSVLRDGWMPTGDVAEVLFDGSMRIVGRLSTNEST